MFSRLILTCFIIINFCSVGQDLMESPFTGLPIELDSTGNYKFIVSGHFHGSSKNYTGYPANTVLANTVWLNESKANMVVCLGDMFLDVSHDIPFYEESFFSKLKIPMYNAVGNHDLTDNIYQENFGATYFYFELNNDVHIFFDTELNDGSIKDEQLDFLKMVVDKKNKYANVFIYSHRTIWAKSYNELDNLFKDNTQSLLGNNFDSDVKPLLNEISKKSNVFWFSGSLGNAPASFFNFKDNRINYIGTAIRGLPRDAVLIVNVIDNNVSFELKSFTGQNLLTLQDYDVEFWEKNVGVEEFNYRLIPYYFMLTLTHRYFWFGVLSTFIIIFSFKLINRKFFKRK